MKNILVLFVVIIGVIHTTLDGAEITTIAPTTGTTGAKLSIKLAFSAGKVAANDYVIFSTAAATNAVVDADLRFQVASTVTSTAVDYTGEIYFLTVPTATLNVFLKRGDEITKQGSLTLAISGPANDLISKVEATEPTKDKAIKYTFTLKTNVGLKNGDVIYFSNTTTVVSDTNDLNFALTQDEKEATFEKELTAKVNGTFSIFVKSGTSGITKQTAPTIKIASGGFISITVALLLSVFLF